jgi:hypothetical protein
MTISYMIYQAERPVSRPQELAADAVRGELARGLSSLLHGGRGRRATDGHRPASEVSCYPPAEWITASAR